MNNQVKLPIMEIFKRAFLYVFSIKKDLFNGIIIPVLIITLLEAFMGYKSFIIPVDNEVNVLPIIQNILFLIVTCALYRTILQEKKFNIKSFRFGKDEFRFIGAYLLIGVVVALTTLIFTLIFAKLQLVESKTVMQVIMLLVFLLILSFVPKLIVWFPNIIQEEKIIDFKNICKLTKGNNLRILVLSIIYAIIVGLIFGPLTIIFQKNLFFVFVYYFLAFSVKMIQISIFAHVYKYLSFYNKEKDVKEDSEA